MSNMNQNGRGMYGKGYYIALVLCAAAIGISGFLYYRSENESREVLQQPEMQETVPAAVTEDLPVASTLPVQEATKPAQNPTKSQQKALKTAAPVSGQTVGDYAMDCLSYNQTTRDWRVHNGLDIAAPEGTAVMAAADGQVYTIYEDDIMGWTVVIRHQDGYTTTYSSLAEELSVAVGDEVMLGQTIGTVGSSALIETAMGDHVHFSVTHNDELMDPAEFLALGN
jgi:murein DD-endopeptidase MepM/ murein hydrolase activator NlpD